MEPNETSPAVEGRAAAVAPRRAQWRRFAAGAGVLAGVLVALTAVPAAADGGSLDAVRAAGALSLAVPHAAAVSCFVVRSRWRGWRLVGATAAVYFAVTGVLVPAGAYALSPLLADPVAASALPGIVFESAVAAATVAPVAVLVLGRYGPARGFSARDFDPDAGTGATSTAGTGSTAEAGTGSTAEAGVGAATTADRGAPGSFGTGEWAWKLALLSAAAVAVPVAAGVVVFRPLAARLDPGALVPAAAPAAPAWTFVLHALAGLVLVGAAALALRASAGGWRDARPPVAVLLGVLAAAAVVPATPLLAGPARFALAAELLVANAALGWLAVTVLGRHHAPARAAAGRLRRLVGGA